MSPPGSRQKQSFTKVAPRARVSPDDLRWQEIERYLDGGNGLMPERIAWLCRHEELIRPLVEAAKDEHVARYGEGWLKRTLAGTADQRRA